MKTLIIILILVSTGVAWGFSWEGELDPNGFDQWKIIGATMVNPLTMIATAQNPDKEAKIQRIQMFIYIDGTVVSYRYFRGSEIYDYVFNIEKNTYVRHQYAEKDRQSCMQCHDEKLVAKASI